MIEIERAPPLRVGEVLTSTSRTLVTAEYQRLERQDERLESQDQGVHEGERIHGMKRDGTQRAGVLGDDDVVIAGIGVGDATAAGRDALQPAFIKRLEYCEQRPRPRHLLQI